LRRSLVRSLLGFSVGLLAIFSVVASTAWAVDEFPIPTPDSRPAGITAGPGGLWFTEEHTNANKIGLITVGGAVSEFGGLTAAPAPSAGNPPETGPAEIVLGPDGGLWFTEIGANKVGRMAPGGAVTHECSLPSGSGPDGITATPNPGGRIWITLSGTNRVGRIDPSAADPCGSFTSFSGSLNQPGDITLGPDGRLWFTESGGNRISAISTNGSISPGPALPIAGSEPSGITASGAALWATLANTNEIARVDPTTGAVTNFVPVGAGPSAITTGPDGALWFTETGANKIGRLTAGINPTLTNEFAIPTPGSQPGEIAVGPDNALWFTEFASNKIGRIATAPPFVPAAPPPPALPATATKKKCKVPKLKRLTVKKARKKLKRAGCKYKIRGKGRFVSSKPKAGRTTTGTVTVKFKKARRR
jgi:virginiamycin B lyase